MNLLSTARMIGGSVTSRNTISIPTPGHSPGDRGTVITFDPAAPGGFLVHSFNGGDVSAIKDMVKAALGCPSVLLPISIGTVGQQDNRERTKRALELWHASRPAYGTIVERYLGGRRLYLPNDVTDIRFLANCPFGKERHPAMIALMRDIVSNAPKAIHRTALRPDGSGKAAMTDGEPKRMLGPAAGTAIKLNADEEVSLGLGLSEGIENALTAICGGWRPVWAAGSAGAVASFPVLAGIESLSIFADPKPIEVEAARRCAAAWQAAGKEVTIIRPPRDRDWNAEIAQ